ncbi:MAG: hypothetical protein WC615_00230 [Mucilaginibacter sp.]|jgi:hypothetical protein|uniref:hypothetical protein n=1 Tax=Mucilaginibacter sp. TaxID=1882438 RepID=UPI00356528B6
MEIEIQERDSWEKCRFKLIHNYQYNTDWEYAIDILTKRFERKYFLPMEHMILNLKRKGEGFTILTAQCALIETFATLRTGQIFHHQKRAGAPSFHYQQSAKVFTNFLQSAEIFENHFWTAKNGKKLPDLPFKALDFYDKVRCGLLHEARTKGEWYINATSKELMPSGQQVFITRSGNKIKVLRTALHYLLKKHLNNYVADLRKTDQDGEKLRRFFARKMDHIHDIAPDPVKFDWWIDK